MTTTYIFDLDGTLYNRKGLKKRMILRSIAAGRPLSMLACERSCRRAISGIDTGTIGYETLFEAMSHKSGKSLEKVRDWYNNWYMPTMVDEIGKHFPLREGLMERFLSYRQRGAKLAILSDYGCIREKLNALGVESNLFDELLDAPSLGGYKPAPCVFKTTLEILGSRPEDCLMIGDRPERDGGSVKVGIPFAEIEDFMKGSY